MTPVASTRPCASETPACVGVVADDTTGALDMASVFFQAGRTARVWLHPARSPLPTDVDVTVIDTDSRLDTPLAARTKVAAATRALQQARCTHFYKKTCSVFRGNIGAEFDAMLDTLDVPAAVISLVYPALGRSTVQGCQFVSGVPIHQTPFARDPVHPSTTADLTAILARQSRRAAAVIPLDFVRRGAGELRAAIDRSCRDHAWVIVDGENADDLRTLAEAAAGYPLLGGAAGLASVWPQPNPARRTEIRVPPVESSAQTRGVLLVCGSLTPQSQQQVEFLRARGTEFAELPTAAALQDRDRKAWVMATAFAATVALSDGRDFLVHSQFTPPIGADRRMNARSVSTSLSLCVQEIMAHLTPSALVVAGGDTSGGICRSLGIESIDVIDELVPGVPIGFARGSVCLPIVLKSGSFGAPDFLAHASRTIRAFSALPTSLSLPCTKA